VDSGRHSFLLLFYSPARKTWRGTLLCGFVWERQDSNSKVGGCRLNQDGRSVWKVGGGKVMGRIGIWE
jgi:hypothetical protein